MGNTMVHCDRVKGSGKCRRTRVRNPYFGYHKLMCKILCSEEGFGEIRCGWEIIRADNVVIVSVKAIALYVVFIFKELRAICWGRARIKGNMLLMGNGLGQSIVVGKN